eukprot:GFYU01000061.1.p1 GENE.GFYU01000061.1~~GFYU01000061.1.p1  ORF type:complete len:310 (-),score=105.97 GFYU01000061.1:175-1104(-)
MAFNFVKGVAEYFTPVLTSSAFLEKGVLTPEEFVAAGDLLVYKCPTWAWEAGDPSKTKSYLPADKQYLVTKNVPCHRRVRSLETSVGEEDMVEVDGEGDEAWVSTMFDKALGGQSSMGDEIGDIPSAGDTQMGGIAPIESMEIDASGTLGGGDDDVPDMAEFEDDNLMDTDGSTLQTGYIKREEPADNIVRTRRYDLHITYDKYYQTPRVWLFGYDEGRSPLTPEQIFEDVSQDHANKTVTMETHPNLGVVHASVHPCRHASVMKKIVGHLTENGKDARVDHYLFLFLKFIQAVIPTVEYDFTMAVAAK